ncbi:type II and III secretion system protein family protein [Shewanella algae]|uniref:type II and III secretion system protein family protein n=1 Tax=Shewanella algae TaxID=38313 RepID=UPI000F427D2E|nr:pilus assembly protein N-terminal domain-containing protein [Shewanella algae]AYV11945.1 type II/III secretion system protein [Shewanella algae]
MRSFILFLAALLLPWQTFAHNNPPLSLYVGAVELYKVNNVERVVVGNGAILSAKVIDDKGVLLIGESEGVSDLQLWQKNGKLIKRSVTVYAKNQLTSIQNIQHLLASFPKLSVTQSNELLVVQGEVDEKHKGVVEKILTSHPNLISLVEFKQYAPDMVPMVKMQVQIVEFNKSRLNNIGIQWDSVMSGPAFGAAKAFTANPIFSVTSPGNYVGTINEAISDSIGVLDTRGWSYFGIVTGIGSKIQLMAEKGDARMLAQPNLTTRSGEAASFLAGGEFPIPMTSALGVVTVEFKEYGIKLDIEPEVDEHQNIISRVRAEVSAIDPSVAIDDVPGLLTRKAESVINVKNKETMVISGLVNSEMSKSVSRFPLLGDIPILGELFKSRNFRENKTELVIFVTPTIVYPGHEEHEAQLARGKELAAEADQLEAFYILD